MSERIVQQPVATQTQAKFADLPTADVDRSSFDMSHPWKGTMDSKNIVPCLLQEILPGDTFNVKTTAFMRLATPIKPIMDSITADIHYFFVPNRLVWDNWQFFMGERKNPDDDPTTVSIPQYNANIDLPAQAQTLQDYFGLPMIESIDPVETGVNALPFRGYALIWNEWYRNQNLFPSAVIPTDDGPDEESLGGLGILATRHKRGDYFTRALPWPQKGDPVYLPLGTSAPIVAMEPPYAFKGVTSQDPLLLRRDANDPNEVAYTTESGNALAANEQINIFANADLTQATAATINDIRTAFQIQKLLERDARGGTRYIEIILSHFNVQSPDARLQRPEYLGGGSSRITINPVASTVETENAPQANLAAVGTGLVKASFNHSFTEHGFVFGLVSCRADLTYQNGLDRMWDRKTRYDYYWPALSHLGEQAIKNKEIFWQQDSEINNSTWGFQERYAEYRYQPGRVTGLFRSEHPESLDVWHLAQDFTELPELDGPFLLENPPIDRVVAVPSEPDLIVDMWHQIKATRPMPVYSVPGMVDHF